MTRRTTLCLTMSLLGVLSFPAAARAEQSAADDPVPVLAHYYIWFNPTSWNRAKTDYPLLGRYSSDESRVMRRHIEWAQQAGIDGFIVSWKSTDVLDRRLDQLVRIARDMDFKLGITYQGLDFFRDPLPATRVRSDLASFADRYAADPVFDIFGRPLVIWSGTWSFTRSQMASVTHSARDDLLILGSERSVEDYERIADLVDGDAYYWSSVNPETYPDYQGKLDSMSRAVDRHRGLWIAPAAPGFDGRLVGGRTVVPRNAGETLRDQMRVALASSPDAVGLISWNEFSENTHVEPSLEHGARYLRVVADIVGAPEPEVGDFDSSAPQGTYSGSSAVLAIGGVAALGFLSVTVIFRRARFSRSPLWRERDRQQDVAGDIGTGGD